MIFTLFFIRFFDIFLSFFAIVFLLPFMLPIILVLKLTGEHYIFYRQKRVGRHGNEFYLLKFATMLKDSPNMPGGYFTQKNDPRMLSIGKFLRKTKINELPQLINILIGQMSIIGYRPLVEIQYKHYTQDVKQILFYMRPGLSSISSIIFRNEEEIFQKIESGENICDRIKFYCETIIPYKGELECYYAKNYSVWNYFKLIIMTVISVLQPKSYFWKRAFKNLPEMPKELASYF